MYSTPMHIVTKQYTGNAICARQWQCILYENGVVNEPVCDVANIWLAVYALHLMGWNIWKVISTLLILL